MNLKRLMKIKDSEDYELNWDVLKDIEVGGGDQDILLEVCDFGYREDGIDQDPYEKCETVFDKYIDQDEKALKVKEAETYNEEKKRAGKAWRRAMIRALQRTLPDANTFARYSRDFQRERAYQRRDPKTIELLNNFVVDIRKSSPYPLEYDKGDNIFYSK